METIKIHYTAFIANESFFACFNSLDLLVEAPLFKEYKHRSLLQIYVRLDKSIKLNQRVVMFVEPQLNMSATCRDTSGSHFKLQLSITNKIGYHYQSKNWFELKQHFIEFNHESFVKYLQACPFWTERVAKVFLESINSTQTELSI